MARRRAKAQIAIDARPEALRNPPMRFPKACFLLSLFAAAGGCDRARQRSQLVVWAWERPEDLRFLGSEAEIAFQSGFVEISGGGVRARGRRFPLKVARAPETLLVHVQIDHRSPLKWSPELRERVSGAVLHYAEAAPVRRVQLDFEVRQSERQVLADVLTDLRRGLPRGTLLSMTALASWCAHEDWIGTLPVDEIVPMLFRMERNGENIKKQLANGQDFRNHHCRAALGISTDSPILRAPPGRRVYLFNPHSWNEAEFRQIRRAVEAWR
jgi:hypothetical protein